LGLAAVAMLAALTEVTCMFYPLNLIRAAINCRSRLVYPMFDRMAGTFV
jgi:hypothetical protein